MVKILKNFKLLISKLFNYSQSNSLIEVDHYKSKLLVYRGQHDLIKHKFNFYEKNEQDFFYKTCKKNDTFLDIGANIGLYSIMLCPKIKEVISIEPIYKNVKILEMSSIISNIKI